MYMSNKTLDYVIFSHQANLSKTTKHWDGFVSHCTFFTGLLRMGYMSLAMPLASMAHCRYAKAVAAGTQLC